MSAAPSLACPVVSQLRCPEEQSLGGTSWGSSAWFSSLFLGLFFLVKSGTSEFYLLQTFLLFLPKGSVRNLQQWA